MNEENNDNKNNNQENNELENKYLDDEIQEENNNVEEDSENSAKEVAEAVKAGTSLAKNAASGNVLGAAKDAIKLAKNKKLRKKVIINAIMNVLIPFIIIIFLGASILGIFNAVGNVIQGIIDSISNFFTVDSTDGSITIDDKQINEIMAAIEDLGVSAEDLKLLGDYTENATEEEKQAAMEKYIRKFYEAQAVTETLNYYHKDSTNDKTYGAIYVYRANEGDTNGTNRRKLHYIKYEDMKKKQEAGDSSALDSFSIDDSGNLVIAGKTQVIKESGSSEDALHENSNVTTITLRNIDYKSATSKYTTQMNFLIYLTMVSQNPEFVAALTDLIKDTRIEITVMDNVSTYVDLQTYKYDLNIKTKHEVKENEIVVDSYSTISKEPDITEVTKETTITTNPSINITYVKTWFCEQKITYNKQQDGPTTNINVNNLPDEAEPQEQGIWKTNQSNTIKDTTTNIKYVEGIRGNVTFILGERGDAEKYKNGQISEPTFIGLMETEFRIPYSTRPEKAGSNLESGAEILFYLLQKDSNLENMELIMRYALYLYSGKEKDYGVTSLDGSIFEISNIVSISDYLGTGFWWPVGSLEIENIDGKEFAKGTPTSTKITSSFGYRDKPTAGATSYHQGIDISSSGYGSNYHNIIASADGVVTRVRDGQLDGVQTPAEGNFVEIEHSNGIKTLYKHLYNGSIKVKVGDNVKQGQVLGKMGNSGASTGAHLHFEVRVNGTAVNPEEYVSTSNPRPVGGSAASFSLSSTTFSQEEFKEKMLEYANKTGNTNFKTNFANHADEIYTASLSNGVNPELVVVTAGCETGWKKNSMNNYWGIGIPNGGSWSDGPYFETLTEGIKRYASVIASYQPGGSMASMIIQRCQERKADNCNPNGYGMPGTFAGMQSVYSDLAGNNNIHREGGQASGGNYYLKIIYGDKFNEKCGNVHKIGVDQYTNQERADYTAWQCETKVNLRYAIFGL